MCFIRNMLWRIILRIIIYIPQLQCCSTIGVMWHSRKTYWSGSGLSIYQYWSLVVPRVLAWHPQHERCTEILAPCSVAQLTSTAWPMLLIQHLERLRLMKWSKSGAWKSFSVSFDWCQNNKKKVKMKKIPAHLRLTKNIEYNRLFHNS